jgi:hypothetical protein
MVKATVYIDEQDAAALRKLVAATGRSQAQLIREAIAEKIRTEEPRRLSFIGAGEGTGEPISRDADQIVRAELGQSPR